ncbi:YbjN domain-containing protein [Pseudomonas mosselii]|uniref:YbjN domain-containing protein n=1 Tax=Pseudomonas mosselii TaxID=78327 RepID=A0A5R8YY51_9PSED|nr:YbjN domain-containing protein [Pseudomonas mosselii]TLP58301.1 YbjN domain-containing protein [Pseudomonas mosselii]
MNAASESATPPSAVNQESLDVLAQWLKHHGSIRVRTTDPRRLLNGRYPQGLISDAELEALLAVWH